MGADHRATLYFCPSPRVAIPRVAAHLTAFTNFFTSSDENPWQALRSGAAVGLLRHALAPSVGDPAHLRLEDCATQRNLSEAGRKQARAIGAAFRRNGITSARVLCSRWCRCLETACLCQATP
jgi:hypothetical protein